MKKTDFLNTLNPLIPKMYSFAYSMIPDDLQARQLVIDAGNVFFIKEKDFVQGIATEWTDLNLRKQYSKELVKGMLEHIFKLGQKRFKQIYTHPETLNNLGVYYRELDVLERAILFLKHKFNLSINDLKLVTDLEKHQIIEKIYMARTALAQANKLENTILGQASWSRE